MRALDTNLLVRILTRDNEDEARAVDDLLAESSDEAFFVPATVMLEIEWVLRSAYKKTRLERIGAFNALLSNGALSVERHGAFEVALDLFERVARSDLADCMHLALAEAHENGPHSPLVTFDKICSRLPGTQRLSA